MTYEEALELLKFPDDFDQWDLANKNGWSVAHQKL
jgi:hypothetical protein